MWPVVLFLIVGTARANLQYNTINNTDDPNIRIDYHPLNVENPCARVCISDAAPMVCRYHFVMEYYHTLSKACYDCPYNTTDCFRPDCVPGDGHKRPVVAINRQIPGPLIEVCQGDTIIADVENLLGSEGTTIHWHGQHMKDTPYMDGVPYVTQCPILPHNTFRYSFTAEQAGTHFWHSHLGMQRSDGAFGALIVRVPEDQDPHFQFYDYDLPSHVMNIIDWERQTGLEKFLAHHHNDADNKPSTILVNGLGRHKQFPTEVNGSVVYVPAARFQVEQGYRYRFRVINAGFLNCPIEISVDNHTLTVISTDGMDIEPTEAVSLVTYAGERFDFILNADQPKDLYWIRFRGLMDCDERFKRAHQVAVLEYQGLGTTMDDYPSADTDYDVRREGTQINALNRGVESNTSYISMPQLKSLNKWDSALKEIPDVQYYVAYDFYRLDNVYFNKAPHYGFENITDPDLLLLTPQFNHISMKVPTFPLLPQRNEITEGMFCNRENIDVQNCTENYCECPHGIEVPLNAVVELVFVDEGFAYEANHPLHIHGHAFRVVAMERLGLNVTVDEVKSRDAQGLIKRNLLDAPIKDTVTVPDGGYTIVRFQTTNPGYWIFHCHIEFHAEIGMAMVIKTGSDDDMLPVPKNFPRCGNYMPESQPVVSCTGADCGKTTCDRSGFLNTIENLLEIDGRCSGASTVTTTMSYIVAVITLVALTM